jgi:hypothetical protein
MNVKCHYHGISQRCSMLRQYGILSAAALTGTSCFFAKEYSMQEKTEWEVVDEPMPQPGSQWRSQEDARMNGQGAPGMGQILKALMGPWWRWKLLGAGLFAALAVAMLAMLTGVFAVIAAVGAALAIGFAKLRQWTRRHTGALTP